MGRDPLLLGGQAPCLAELVPRAVPPGPRSLSWSPALHRPLGEPTRDQRAMSPGERAGGDARKDGPAGGGGGCGRPATAAGAWAVSALCLLLSVGSAAACLLLGAQAAALQGRVAALEEEREQLRRAGPPSALVAWAEPHLERLLREVRRRAGRARWEGVGPVAGSVRALGVRAGGGLPEEGSPGGSVRESIRAACAEGGGCRCRPRGFLLSPLQP